MINITKVVLIIVFANLAFGTVAAQQVKNQEYAKFNNIGDTTILAEAEDLIKEAQSKLLVAPTTGRSEEFRTVRSFRQRLNKRAPELRVFLESFRQYRVSLVAQTQQKQSSLTSKRDGDAEGKLYDLEIERINQLVTSDRAEHETLKSRLGVAGISDDERRLIEQKVKETDLSARRRELEAKMLERRRAEIVNASTATQREVDDANKAIATIDSIISDAQANLRQLDEKLVELDERSNHLLETETLNLGYTDRSTYIFAVLVGAVILGFFVIAFRSEKVSDAIFTGDSGIQFVTLFSLVIAIILFGVLKILEAKELAALLGGLSGYILGRGSSLAASAGGGKKVEETPSSEGK